MHSATQRQLGRGGEWAGAVGVGDPFDETLSRPTSDGTIMI